MNSADFNRLDLAKFHALPNRERNRLMQAMTSQQQKQTNAAISAAFASGAATPKPKPARAFSGERAAQIYAKRQQATTEHANAKRGPAFGSKEFADAIFSKRAQASGSGHATLD